MKLVLLVGLLALVVGTAARGGGTLPMAVTYENFAWLDRGPYEDPFCLNEDDRLFVQARGDLAAGESFGYQPAYPSCARRVVWGEFTFKGAHNQDHPNVVVTGASPSYSCVGCGTFGDDGIQYRSTYDCYVGKPCWKGSFCFNYSAYAGWPDDGTGRSTFAIEVRNVGPIPASNVYLNVENDTDWVHTC